MSEKLELGSVEIEEPIIKREKRVSELDEFMGYEEANGVTVARFFDPSAGEAIRFIKSDLEERKANLDKNHEPSEQTSKALKGWPKK